MNIEKKERVWATTEDNPYNPFTQFDRWANYDYNCGYNTCDRIARLAGGSDDNMTDEENDYFRNEAVKDLCNGGFVIAPDGTSIILYRLVTPETCVTF